MIGEAQTGTGFGGLMGYGGQQQNFTVSHATHVTDFTRLPTASSCFNQLNLPSYRNEVELRTKLRQAINGYEGFHEGAVAV